MIVGRYIRGNVCPLAQFDDVRTKLTSFPILDVYAPYECRYEMMTKNEVNRTPFEVVYIIHIIVSNM
jgi:hypothetical protein